MAGISVGFTPVVGNYVDPANLDVVSNAYSTIQQRHDATIETKSELSAKLAALPLNAAEEGWRQEQLNALESSLNDNLVYGNASAAYDDVIRTADAIVTSPEMRSKIRSQAQYDEYMKQIDASNLTTDKKNYFKEVNKYYDAGLTDDWKPTDQFVDEINMEDLKLQAYKLAARRKGGGNNIYFMDRNGQYTTDISQSIDGLPYISKGGEYEILDEATLREAMNSVIANTPGAQASIDQDYKVAMWKHKRNGGTDISDVTDNAGVYLTRDQYLEKRLQGFYKSAPYAHFKSTIEPLAGLSVGAYKARAAQAKAAAGKGTFNLPDLMSRARNTTPGPFIEKASAYETNIANKGGAFKTLANAVSRYGVDVTDLTPDQMYSRAKAIAQQRGGVIPYEIYDAYNKYNDANAKYQEIMKQIPDQDMRDRIEFVSAMDAKLGLDTIKDNPYAKQYTERYNKLIEDSDMLSSDGKILIPVEDYDKPGFWGSLGQVLGRAWGFDRLNTGKGVDKALQVLDKSYGATKYTVDRNGRVDSSVIAIDRDKYYLIPQILQDLDAAGLKYNINAFDAYPILASGINPFNTENAQFTQAHAWRINQLNEIYNSAKRSIDDFIGQPEAQPLEIVSDADIIETFAQDAVARALPEEKATAYNAAVKNAQQKIDASILNARGSQVDNFQVGINGETLKDVDNTQARDALFEIARQVRQNNSYGTFGIGYDKNTLRSVMTIGLNKDIDPDSSLAKAVQAAKDAGVDLDDAWNFTIACDNMFNNEDKMEFMSSPSFLANLEYYTDNQSGLTSHEMPLGMTVEYDPVSHLSYMGSPTTGYEQVDSSTAVYGKATKGMYDKIKWNYLAMKHQYGADNIPTDQLAMFQLSVLQLVKNMVPGNSQAQSPTQLTTDAQVRYNQLLYQLMDEEF